MAAMNRKTFLKMAVNSIGFLAAGIVAGPVLLTAFSPVRDRKRQAVWVVVGPLLDFPENSMNRAAVPVPREDWSKSLREKGVYVWRPSLDEVVVFSRNCTDLGCPVTWDSGSGWFFCPCHGGIFAQNGERKAGPPKRPLFRFANRVRNGIIEIDLNSVPVVA